MMHARTRHAGFGLLVGGLVLALTDCDDSTPSSPPPVNPIDPTKPPHVIATYPPSGGTGPFDLYVPGSARKPHFIVIFDKLIDQSRFNSNWFQLEGSTAPLRFLVLERSSGYTDRLAVGVTLANGYTSMNYEIGHTYTVTIDTTLIDLTGNRLEAPYRFSFVPEPHFRVVSVDLPEGERVAPLARPVVEFNADFDLTTGAAMSLDPDIPGNWLDFKYPNQVVFIHTQPFRFGASYELRIDPTAADQAGNRLPQLFTETFRVSDFEVDRTYPYDGMLQFPPSATVSIFLTGPVDTTTVSQFPPGQLVPGTSGRWVSNASILSFEPDSDFLPSMHYDVTLTTSLRGWDGSPLMTPYTFSFTTDVFRMTSSTIYDGEIEVSPGATQSFIFSMHLDPVTVEPAFSISPSASGTIELDPEGQIVFFTPVTPLAPQTDYTITISTALRAKNGSVFPEPYSISFTTGSQ